MTTNDAEVEQRGDWQFLKRKITWAGLVAKLGEEKARTAICFPGPRHSDGWCAWKPEGQYGRYYQEVEGFPGGPHGSLVEIEYHTCTVCGAPPKTPCAHPGYREGSRYAR